jgi:flagellar protein FliS
MAGRYPHNAYLDTQVKTASKEQLLMMLFDGAIKFAHQAKIGIESRNIEATSTNAVKVQNIVNELMSSLDKDLISPELYSNLMSLYAFVHKRMVAANVQRNAPACDEAIEILHRLRGIWKDAIEQVLAQNGGKLPPMPERPVQQGQPAGVVPPKPLTNAMPGGANGSSPAMPPAPKPTTSYGAGATGFRPAAMPATAAQLPNVAPSTQRPAVAASAPSAPMSGVPAQNGQRFPMPTPGQVTAGHANGAAPASPLPAAPARPPMPGAPVAAASGAKPAVPGAPAAPAALKRPKLNLSKQ